MPRTDKLRAFLTATVEERIQMVTERGMIPLLQSYLGKRGYREYVGLARRVGPALAARLLDGKTPNLLFVPGVMGSLLQSTLKGGIWWIDIRTRKHIEDLKLAPDGSHSADHLNEVAPCTTDPTYEPFRVAALERDDFGHDVFPYDWRKPFRHVIGGLRNKILEMHANNGGKQVHLVAHSMGGLVVRAALMLYGSEIWPKVGRIVFIGTPHYGSPAVAGYLKNHLWGFDEMALLGIFLSRATLRSLWGVLGMLPSPRGIYPGTRSNDPQPWSSNDPSDPYVHPCANFDMYKATNWRLCLNKSETRNLQAVLDGAAAFHKELFSAHRALSQEHRNQMAVIAGVGMKTLFRLAYAPGFLGIWEHTTRVFTNRAADIHRDGDGRVPLASACLEDIGDTRYIRAVHASLPMIPAVYDDVFRWLNEEEMELPRAAQEAYSQHLAGGSLLSQVPNLDGSYRANFRTGDPGYWNEKPPDAARIAELRKKLPKGEVPEFVKVRLL